MNNYNWGVDGYGRQHIIHTSNDRKIIMCALGHGAKGCIELLKQQGYQNESTNKQ